MTRIDHIALREVLDELGVERHCCRRMLVSHKDLVDVVAPYQ